MLKPILLFYKYIYPDNIYRTNKRKTQSRPLSLRLRPKGKTEGSFRAYIV